MLLVGKAFDRCIACSPSVLSGFKEGGAGFVLNAMNRPEFLEDVTGLSQVCGDRCSFVFITVGVDFCLRIFFHSLMMEYCGFGSVISLY